MTVAVLAGIVERRLRSAGDAAGVRTIGALDERMPVVLDAGRILAGARSPG